MRLFLLLLMFVSANSTAQTKFIKYKKYLIPVGCSKPKVVVSTDYGVVPTNTDANEPQDLVHYLAYSNHFDTRAIVASGNGTASDLSGAIDKYDSDYNTYFLTSTFGSDFPTPDYLDGVLYTGVEKQLGATPTNSNPSTIKIRDEARDATPQCPLHILVWGPMTDVAASVHQLSTTERDNVRIVAIGSSNATNDQKAWDYIEDIRDAGGTVFSENIFLMDGGSPTDAFRRLHLGHTCGVNPTLYNDNGVTGKTEDIMDDLADNVLTTDPGLRGLLQSTRGNFSDEELANWQNCQSDSMNSANSLRVADAMSTMYLLDSVMGFNGTLKQMIEDNNASSTTGTGDPAVLRKIYDHFRARMDDIY